MKHSAKISTLLTIFGAGFLVAQEPVDVKAPKEEIERAFQEQHYPIKVTFRVIDESGNPVLGADMDIGIDSLLHLDGYNNYRGKTNGDGLFTVESRGRGCTEVVVSKEGFYTSRPEVSWDGELNPGGPEMQKNGGFRPWNPTVDVTLKGVGKPIPMIVRYSGFHAAPKLGEEIGFDMLVGDWVRPNGKGVVSDLLVRFDSMFVSDENYKTDATIRFSNTDDGFYSIDEISAKESLLKFPRNAPEDDYPIERILTKDPISEIRIFAKEKQPLGYLFRIRTIKDKATGKVISALYGKIVGRHGTSDNINPFEFNTVNRNKKRELVLEPSFTFSYYLNPTPNDRNLEYDQQNNLAPEADKGATYPP